MRSVRLGCKATGLPEVRWFVQQRRLLTSAFRFWIIPRIHDINLEIISSLIDWKYFFCHVLDSSILHHRIPSLHFSQGRADTIVNLPTITLFITRHTCAQHFPESWPTIFSSTHPANSIFHTGDPTRSNTYICDLCSSRTHLFPIWNILMPGKTSTGHVCADEPFALPPGRLYLWRFTL